MTSHIDLDSITLHHGEHSGPDDGHCLLEVVSMFAHEPFSDRPACVCPTLAAFGRSWNDGMRTDDERAQLKRYIPMLPGTRGSHEDASWRAWLALDWSVRVSTPAWLDLAGLADHAQRLRGFGEIAGLDDDVFEALEDARKAGAAAGAAARDAAGAAARDVAWDAAGAAARDAAGAAARDVAWDVAWDAAWAAARDVAWAAAWAAARDVAWDAAGAAAREAAWAAARDAAWAAARDAARAAARDAARAAARAAAWDAFRDSLQPTVTTLQASAHDLYLRMIQAGPHDPVAVAALPAAQVEA